MALDKITTGVIADDAITAAKIVAGAVVADIANDSIDSQHYVAASIDNEHLADDAVGTAELANDVAISTSGAITTTGALAGATLTTTGNIVMGDDTSIGIADDAERIEFDGAGDISIMGANLGINTTSPSQLLQILSTADGTSLFTCRDVSDGFDIFTVAADADGDGVLSMKSGANSGTVQINTNGNSFLNGGNVGIGIEPTFKLQVEGNCKIKDEVYFPSAYSSNLQYSTLRDVQVRNTDGRMGYNASSLRYKENVINMGNIDWLYNLRPVEFDWKERGENGEVFHDYGLIAEEVFGINPELTTPNENYGLNEDEVNEVETVEFRKLIPFLLKAVQDLSAKNDALEVENTALKTRMDALEARVLALES